MPVETDSLIIKSGRLITPDHIFQGDILVKSDRIEEIAEQIDHPGASIVDARGKLVFPGFIDSHTHMGIPIKNTSSADDFVSGSAAALYGGVTTIIDFTVQAPGESLASAVQRRKRLAAGRTSVDYALHCNVTDFHKGILAEIPDIVRDGILSFKIFTAYKEAGMQLDDVQIMRLLWQVKKNAGTVMVHAENGGIISFLTDLFVGHGKTGAPYQAASRPQEAEIEAVWRLLNMNQIVKCPLYFVHLSTAQAVQMVAAAREQGQPVYAETCPQYLMFDQSVYERPDGHRYIAAPPFRESSDSTFLWQALQQGWVDTVGTDHCPFTREQKDAAGGRFDQTPNGLPGVETLFPLLYSGGVARNRLSLQRLVRLIADEPARLFGLYPRKGVLLKGADADLVLVDPVKKWRVAAGDLHSATDWNPYEGMKITGAVESVMLRGKWLLLNSRPVPENGGRGEFVPAIMG